MKASYRNFQYRMHYWFDPNSPHPAARIINLTILGLVLVSVTSVFLETIAGVARENAHLFRTIERVTIAIFTVEYFFRVWVAGADIRYGSGLAGRLKYMISAYALIDFFAIAPFYIPSAYAHDFRFILVLRLFRLFKLFRLSRYTKTLTLFMRVIRKRKEELILAVFFTILLIVVSSGIMYFIEHPAQPEAFSSIPASAWWAVVTVTTVGYGDVVPVTPLGKFFAMIVALCGVALIALPTAIFAAGLIAELHEEQHAPRNCPHCGKPL